MAHIDAASYQGFEGVLEQTNTLDWNDGLGGAALEVAVLGPLLGNDVCTTTTAWPASRWPAMANGTWSTSCLVMGDTQGTAAAPAIPSEHLDYHLCLYSSLGLIVPDWHEQIQHDQTVMKMQTGGRASSGRQSLYWIWGGAVGMLYDDWMPWLENTWQSDAGPPTTNIPPQFIQIGNLGTLDTNGYLFVVLPDGTNVDVTPTLVGMYSYINNYTFGVNAQKYWPRISFLGQDVTSTDITAIVGQQIILTCDLLGLPGSTPPPITNYQWTIPSYAISNYIADLNTAKVYEVFIKTNKQCEFY